MTQAELEREVSRATGESRQTVRRRGFSIQQFSDRPLADDFQEAEPQMIDWDAQDAKHRRAA